MSLALFCDTEPEQVDASRARDYVMERFIRAAAGFHGAGYATRTDR